MCIAQLVFRGGGCCQREQEKGSGEPHLVSLWNWLPSGFVRGAKAEELPAQERARISRMAGHASRVELALGRDQTTAFRDQEVVTIMEVVSLIKSLFHLLGLVPEDTIQGILKGF